MLGLITWSVTRRLRRSNADNRFLARRDPLTRMANRFAIVEDVQAGLDRADAGHGMTVAILDIDGFTEINEVLGHANGDRFLRHVAGDRRRARSATTGITARIGADQFADRAPARRRCRRRPRCSTGSAPRCSTSSSSTASP